MGAVLFQGMLAAGLQREEFTETSRTRCLQISFICVREAGSKYIWYFGLSRSYLEKELWLSYSAFNCCVYQEQLLLLLLSLRGRWLEQLPIFPDQIPKRGVYTGYMILLSLDSVVFFSNAGHLYIPSFYIIFFFWLYVVAFNVKMLTILWDWWELKSAVWMVELLFQTGNRRLLISLLSGCFCFYNSIKVLIYVSLSSRMLTWVCLVSENKTKTWP